MSGLDLPEAPEPLGGWVVYAACRDVETSVFFPKAGRRPVEALRLCAGCVVRPECLEYALRAHQHCGVWGGMTERQRFDEKRRRKSAGT